MPIVGIDLGTSSCSVAMLVDGEPQVLPVFDGRDEMPTYVAFNSDGERLVGMAAKRQAVANPANTIFTIKRLIGRKFASQETQAELGLLPYRIVPSTAGYLWIEAGGRSYTPTEITAIMLAEVRRATEAYLDTSVTKAVITVPAYFDEAQNQATREAARIAGIDVVGLIAEPTAAALALGFGVHARYITGTIGVYDLGGGTFDFSLLEIGDGVYEVKAVNGNNRLGGEDFDHILVHHFVTKLKTEYGSDLSKDPLALHRIKEASEQIKIELDVTQRSMARLPYLFAKNGALVNIELRLTREEMEGLFKGTIEQTLRPCARALKDAGMRPSDLSALVLVGGMSRMPSVRRRVSDFFGIAPQQHYNPSRVVALGAAISAGVKDHLIKDLLLLDVIPLSLGIEGPGGVFIRVIDRNTTFPTKKSMTHPDPEFLIKSGELKVFQGDHEIATNNTFIGSVPVDFVDKKTQLDITMDVFGLAGFGVSVKDKISGKENQKTMMALDPFGRGLGIHFEDVTAARARADELLTVVNAALMAYHDHLRPETLLAIHEAREGLQRAMQSRDGSELTGALVALSAASGLQPPSSESQPPSTATVTSRGWFSRMFRRSRSENHATATSGSENHAAATTGSEEHAAASSGSEDHVAAFSAAVQAGRVRQRGPLVAENVGQPVELQPVSIKATSPGQAVFVSYASDDRRWLDRLRIHLVPLEREGKVEIWHDKKMETGDLWQSEIEHALGKFSAAILLVSAAFMASDFIYNRELPPILQRSRERGLKVFPVVVGHCLYERHPDLSKINAFNDPKRPFSALTEGEVEAELKRLADLLWSFLEGA